MRQAGRVLFVLACLIAAGCAAVVQDNQKDKEKAKEAPPAVRKAECRWATNAIRINGTLDEIAWEGAQELKDFSAFWQKRKAATKTTARLLWDKNYLYFCAEMEDLDLFALTKERNGMTWEDDVFELFFKPSDKSPAYYEFQVNALNTQLELFLPSRGAGGYRRFAPLTKLGMESAVKLNGTLNKHEDRDKGWNVEGRIPWTAFKATGGRPKAGETWKFALCRYDYSVYLERTDLSSTAPLTQPDFHRYEDYGELTFVMPKD
jgi:Carbohydrate family 9 binding domain-like